MGELSVVLSKPAARYSPADVAHLRPSTGLEMMDRVFVLLRCRAGLLLAMGALGAVASLQAELLLRRGEAGGIGALAAKLAAQWPLAAALTGAFQAFLLPRRPLGRWASLRGVLGRLPHLLLTYLLADAVLGMMGLLTGQMLLLPNGGWTTDRGAWALGGVMGALILYLAALWSLAPAVVLLEGKLLLGALGRSSELMRLQFSSRLFGDSAMRRLLLLMTVAATLLAASRLTVPLLRWSGEGMAPEMAGMSPLFWEAAQFAVEILLVCFLFSYVQTAMAVLYSECRIRREALDLQTRLMLREGSGEPGEAE